MYNIQYCEDLLSNYNNENRALYPRKIKFKGVEGYDVYNPTVPFDYNGRTLMIGRVEKRDSEKSQAVFFERLKDDTYAEVARMRRYDLQDPFITKIGSMWVFGGVETFAHPDNPNNLWWRTKFYAGDDLFNLKTLTYGPNGMKDIRLVELANGKVGVFTRPQGDVGGRGKIGFTIIDKLEDLCVEVIQRAKLLRQFDDEEWGGVNQPLLLDNGNIGVIGHIAKFSNDGARHYYSIAFTLNPVDGSYSPMKIIAARKDFLDGEAKRDDLVDVLFSAGIVEENEIIRLYVGVSDIEVQSIQIDNPF